MDTLNNFIQVPEFTLIKLIRVAINFIREDYKKQINEFNDETLSFLYYLTGQVGYERMILFNQMKKIFLIEDPEDPKRLNVTLGYPQDIKGATAICIVHAGEKYADNAMSVDQSIGIYEEYVYDKSLPEDQKTESNAYRESYARRYSTNYQMIITGDNTNEVIGVYTILKSLLISFEGTSHLAAIGLQNVKITGNDLQIKAQIAKPIFAKALNFQFEYPFRVPDVNRLEYINNIIFKQYLLEK